MPQPHIIKKAKAALQTNNTEELRKILKSTEEKPDAETVSEIFIWAARLNKWDEVYEISQMEGDNQPDQQSLATVLGRAYAKHKLEEFVWLCQNSKQIPVQATIESLLDTAIESIRNSRYDYLEYLCFLPTDNKPRQVFIDKAFKEVIEKPKTWPLASKFIQMRGENAPSEEAKAYGLMQTYQGNRFNEFKFICEQSKTPPSEATIVSMLITLIKESGPTLWRYISYLCFFDRDIELPQSCSDEILIKAAKEEQWDLASGLLRKKANNLPSQRAIEFLFEAAAGANEVDLMAEICSFPPGRSPRSSSISKGLIRAAEAGHLDPVTFIAEMKSENKPSPQAFEEAYIKAASYNNSNILHYLVTQIEFSPHTIDLALVGAAKTSSLATIGFLFSAKNPTQPTQAGIKKAFIEAVRTNQLRAVEYFIDPKNKLVLEYEIIDVAMQMATNDLMIKRLKPIHEAMKPALSKTETRVAPVALPTASVKPTAPARLDQLSQIRNAVTRAQSLYQEWYEDTDGKKNIRCANGFFSHWWFRHGVNGQIRAKNILSQVNNTKTTERLATNIVNTFLQDSGTAYHRHSFSSFLLDELKKIKDGPWSKISFNGSYHYDQEDVILKLKQNQAVGFRR